MDPVSEKRTYDVGLRFTVDGTCPPQRSALHTALETVRGVSVEASSVEEAEAQVDQIRVALERTADQRGFPRAARHLSRGDPEDGSRYTAA